MIDEIQALLAQIEQCGLTPVQVRVSFEGRRRLMDAVTSVKQMGSEPQDAASSKGALCFGEGLVPVGGIRAVVDRATPGDFVVCVAPVKPQ